MKLKNKKGNWTLIDKEFVIPLENPEGNIAQGKKNVLGIRKIKKGRQEALYGSKVLNKKRKKFDEIAQVWVRIPVENGWFFLKNKANGRVLAAKDEEKTVVSGGLCTLKFLQHVQFKIGPQQIKYSIRFFAGAPLPQSIKQASKNRITNIMIYP